MQTNVPPLQDVLDLTQAHPAHAVDQDALAACIRRVLAGESYPVAALGVVLTDRQTVHTLNKTYLDHDYPTDVLAFPLGDTPDVVDGEVYVDLDTAAERAPEFGVSFDLEVHRYVIHGLLHLMGYTDDTPAGKARMKALEDHYLVPPPTPM